MNYNAYYVYLSGNFPFMQTDNSIDPIIKVLSSADHSAITDFLQAYAEKNPSFKTDFLTHFSHYTDDGTIGDDVRMEIESLAGNYMDRSGFISWDNVGEMSDEVGQYMELARQEYMQGHILNAFNILTSVAEGTLTLLERSDDSSGSLGCVIEEAFELFYELAAESLTESLRAKLIQYCISTFRNETFKGWDWHLDLLDIAVMMQRTDSEAEALRGLLENAASSEWQRSKAMEILCFLELRSKAGEEMDQYIMAHLDIDKFREMAIDRAMMIKAYDKVYVLSEEGARKCKDNWPPHRAKWHNYALRAAMDEGNANMVIRTSKLLFVESDPEKHYSLLKTYVPEDEWDIFVKSFADELNNQSCSAYYYRLLCIKEQWWDKLFCSVADEASLHCLTEYEEYLKADYSTELVELYKKGILDEVGRSSFYGRNAYREICSYLKCMMALGGESEVRSVIEHLRYTYPRRRALLEELSEMC